MRIKGLDFLRGVAIILVLARHGFPDTVLQNIGWVGVDLFFVLSGFLISGLVFQEYFSSGKVEVKKFLMRRGLKIIPPFFFFILVCVILKYFMKHEYYDTTRLMSEVFFTQSYLPTIWLHTWSLAVEMHFYLAFILFTILIVKSRVIEQKRLMIGLLVFIYLIFFFFRFIYSYDRADKTVFIFTQTHLRIDGLLLGTLLSYLYYFTNTLDWFKQNKKFTLGLSAILITPVLIFEGGSFFMNTIGISLMNMGFGLLVLFTVQYDFIESSRRIKVVRIFLRVICFIGVSSYSIYIWHLIALRIVDSLAFLEGVISMIAYFLLAIATGILFYFIIERSLINVRKIFFNTQVI